MSIYVSHIDTHTHIIYLLEAVYFYHTFSTSSHVKIYCSCNSIRSQIRGRE